jgi:hypothetical protein
MCVCRHSDNSPIPSIEIWQTGGTLIVTNALNIVSYEGASRAAHFGSGQLIVSNIFIPSNVSIQFGTGVIKQSGLLEMTGASLHFTGSGAFDFGRVQLDYTNSTISFSASPSLVHFAESSGCTWSNTAGLLITNWSGSVYGGGAQQIIFGTNAAALTPQQLSHIQFKNPGGLPAGVYLARIVGTGEIVPDTGAPLPPRIELSNMTTNGAARLSVGGEIGQTYGIESSTDLVHWLMWTSHINATGTIIFTDVDSANFSRRFYRTRLLPSE